MHALDVKSMKLRTLLAAALCASTLSACYVAEPARPAQPPPVVEVMPAPPAPGYRWVKGHYRWEANHWQWVPGHWRPV
ncbi:BcpO-related WXXGXW repeat protein [Paraburkholderia sp. Tr-20389]|uniref:YXWGXW repeat-containing protein n=1 Tax=Paraburkholderia sp. Tr-20389 TaxID=2703903 RepID=UPI00198254C5|nr:YXWGXW repeat-containing protein [Paraburkholderia sp. Tr-20389]MBN3752730.1 BcpO-related WXXGXW repeat protein [Paraburkholderia sp. Tr-20389]